MIILYFIFFLLIAAAFAIVLWPIRADKKLCAIVAGIFITGTLALYAYVGSPQIVPLLAAREERLAQIKAHIVSNSEIVKADPNNLKAWVTLGESFIETGQYSAAANAFKQSVLLSKGNPDLILAYAKALILSEDGAVNETAKKSLDMVLLQDPKNAEARYFLAVRQLQTGNTKEAMKEMKSLYESLPADSPVKEMIDRQIGKN